ncbi:MAG: LamG domain-containing protein, partial [Myxococcales bacterium]|nr:LamG domain-containing protein [Myxococcales bacterium]
NHRQNFPELTSASTNGIDSTLIAGELESSASTSFRVEFFANTTGGGYGEGETYLGSTTVTTDASGDANILMNVSQVVSPGYTISASATRIDTGSAVETSEFCQVVAVLGAASGSVPSVGNGLPGPQNTDEDTALVFSSGNGNAVTVTDGSAIDAAMRVSLSVTNGTLDLSTTSGLTFENGGDESSVMTFTGSESAINAALEGLEFVPTENFFGGADLQIITELVTAAQYTFDDVGALGDDSVGSGSNDATVVGATAATDPERGAVLDFDGSDHLSIASTFGTPADVTLAAWVDLDAAFDDPAGADVVSISDEIAIRLDDDTGGVSALFYTGSEWETIESDIELAGTGWHHVATSFDGTTLEHRLFIDGVEVASETASAGISYTSPLHSGTTTIGKHANSAERFMLGQIDDVRIYDQALSAGAVSAISNGIDSYTDDIAITVNSVNDQPTTSGIADIAVNESSPDTVVDLLAAFSDVEDLGSDLTFTIESNTNSTLFSGATIDAASDELTLAYAADTPGVSDLTIRATDSGGAFIETT